MSSWNERVNYFFEEGAPKLIFIIGAITLLTHLGYAAIRGFEYLSYDTVMDGLLYLFLGHAWMSNAKLKKEIDEHQCY